MNKILKRDEYIKEVYEPMMEQKKYEELKAVNEGLLKTLFGMTKNLFKKDWSTIKGDPNIIKLYKEMDDKLSGYTTMKLSKKGECNKIRQALVDFACDWYDYKMNQAKESGKGPLPSETMKFKDKTLSENLTNLEKKIKDIAAKDEKMLRWANTLLNDMKTVINRSIIAQIEDEETKKEVEKQVEEMAKEDEKKDAEENKKMEELQNKQLEEIKKEREELISNFGVTPINETITGDKEVNNLCTDFKNLTKKDKSGFNTNLIKNDKTLGLTSLLAGIEEEEKNAANTGNNTENAKEPTSEETLPKKEVKAGNNGQNQTETTQETPKDKLLFHTLDAFYNVLNPVADKFKETPGQSVQAMCIAINLFVKNCIYGNVESIDQSQITLMSKCAIVSDGVISYNLPLSDDTKDVNADNAKNWYSQIVGIITDGKLDIKDEKNKDIKLNDDFKANAKKLFDSIQKEAAKLKKEGEEKYNKQNKEIKTDNDKSKEDLTK